MNKAHGLFKEHAQSKKVTPFHIARELCFTGHNILGKHRENQTKGGEP